MTRSRTGQSRVECQCGQEVFLFYEMFRPSLGPIQPPIHWVSGFCPGLKQHGHDAHLTFASSVEITNECSYFCTLPACIYGVYKGNFAFLLDHCIEQCVAVKTQVKNYL